MKRKEILSELNLGNRHIGKVPFIENNGIQMFEEIRTQQIAGMVAKKKNSHYGIERSENGLKIINWQLAQYGDFYITGYRKENFAFMVSMRDNNGQFKEVSLVAAGITSIDKITFLTVCEQLERENSRGIIHLSKSYLERST